MVRGDCLVLAFACYVISPRFPFLPTCALWGGGPEWKFFVRTWTKIIDLAAPRLEGGCLCSRLSFLGAPEALARSPAVLLFCYFFFFFPCSLFFFLSAVFCFVSSSRPEKRLKLNYLGVPDNHRVIIFGVPLYMLHACKSKGFFLALACGVWSVGVLGKRRVVNGSGTALLTFLSAAFFFLFFILLAVDGTRRLDRRRKT